MVNNQPPKDSGYTIVELLIALTLLGIVTGLAYQGYRFLQRSFQRWQSRVALEQDGGRIMSAIRNDIILWKRIEHAEAATLSVVRDDNKRIVYRLADQQVLRNGRELNPEGVAVARFEFTYFVHDNESETNPYVTEIDAIAIALTVENRAGNFELRCRMSKRNLVIE